MTSVSHEPSPVGRERRSWALQILVPELWTSITIVVMWLAVLFDAIFGPNIVTSNGAGTNTSTVPSAVGLALFAFLGTWVVAKYGYGRANHD